MKAIARLRDRMLTKLALRLWRYMPNQVPVVLQYQDLRIEQVGAMVRVTNDPDRHGVPRDYITAALMRQICKGIEPFVLMTHAPDYAHGPFAQVHYAKLIVGVPDPRSTTWEACTLDGGPRQN